MLVLVLLFCCYLLCSVGMCGALKSSVTKLTTSVTLPIILGRSCTICQSSWVTRCLRQGRWVVATLSLRVIFAATVFVQVPVLDLFAVAAVTCSVDFENSVDHATGDQFGQYLHCLHTPTKLC